jgi:microcystin-dependent protein
MKAPKLISFFTGILFSCALFAQTSDLGFSFQGYGIDPDGKALANTEIIVQFTLSKAGATFTEEHELTTDVFGVFTAVIGSSTVGEKGNFAKLNFTDLSTLELFTLKVEVKKKANGSYTIISNETLKAVPYARAAANGNPVGTILIFAGDLGNVPTGWLPCNGKQISKVDYSQLYTAIGDAWGTPNATSFNVPDLRGMFLRGVDAGAGVDPEAGGRTAANGNGNTGDLVGTIQGNEVQGHGHTIEDPGHNHTNGDFKLILEPQTSSIVFAHGQSGGATAPKTFTSKEMLPNATGITVDSSTGTETRPINAAVHYIIKY